MPKPLIQPPDTQASGLLRLRLRCPQCAAAVRRQRRTWVQRLIGGAGASGHYVCAGPACAWTGLLGRRPHPATSGVGRSKVKTGPALRGLVPLTLAALAVAAAQWGVQRAPVADIAVGARLFARAEAFDGDALPTAHPLWTLAAYDAEPPPLTLRRFCAWARPGRMPYRGTADEALRAAQLPAEVRRQIGAAIARGQATDRLTIGNDTIRAVSSKTEFDPAQIAMTYGRTLCLGTRVNFKPGHVESANLFQATDTDGRVYSVMVPDACGNVSVIKARGPALPGTGGSGHAARDPLDPGDPGDPGTRTTHTAMTDKPNEVPTPGTFALSVLALGIGAALRRRAHREGAARRPS